MNITAFSIYQRQNAALEQIRTEKGNKAVIAAAMLILWASTSTPASAML